MSPIAEYLIESRKGDRVRSWAGNNTPQTALTPEALLDHAGIKYIESYDRSFKEREDVDRLDFYGNWRQRRQF